MTLLAVGLIGQSPARGPFRSNSDTTTGIGAGWKTWNSDETEFGTAYRTAIWGEFPLDREWEAKKTNNTMQGVVAEAPCAVRSVHICKGGHPIEAFITKATRVANGWPEVIEAPFMNMAPYIFDADQGSRLALSVIGKAAFDLVILQQGENRTPDWAAKLAAFHGDLTGAGLVGPATVFLVAGLYDGGPHYAAHKADCLAVLPTLAKAAYVDSAGLLALDDDLHFTGKATVNMGRRLIRKYNEMTA